MIKLNTNLASIIVQANLQKSTRALNTAIERMTSGCKINRAKDNAANYSITTNMSTKIGAYQVAEDNVEMGLDLLTMASENLNLISDKLIRLRALAEQSANGTYGKDSMNAINSEAESLINEIMRIKASAEYNGNNIFGVSPIESGNIGADESKIKKLEPSKNGFLKEVTERGTSSMTKLSSVYSGTKITSGTYSISTKDELYKLQSMVANEKIGAGVEFVLANDITLSEADDKLLIGNSYHSFKGIFDGNGHVIRNLNIKNEGSSYTALFANVENAEIKNLGISGGSVYGTVCGGIVAIGSNSKITNCYTDVDIYCETTSGALAAALEDCVVSYCYSTGDVIQHSTGIGTNNNCGGLLGTLSGTIEYCYSAGDVKVNLSTTTGGVIGAGFDTVTMNNCYSTGDVLGGNCSGGMVGSFMNGSVTNSFSTGNISGINAAAGIIGQGNDYSVSNSFSTGDISGSRYAGGILGNTSPHSSKVTVKNCHSLGNITSEDLAGGISACAGNSTNTFSNSYSIGDIYGKNYAGGIVGQECWNTFGRYTNCHSNGKISSDVNAGLLCGVCPIAVTFTDCSYNGSVNKGLDIAEAGNKIKASNIYDASAPVDTVLQVGINSDENSQIDMNSFFSTVGLNSLLKTGFNNSNSLDIIDSCLSKINAKQTSLGAVQNCLESSLEEISAQYENLVSSRSTLRDVDVAKISSEYIRQQILQQASATLLATANQSPSLALMLI